MKILIAFCLAFAFCASAKSQPLPQPWYQSNLAQYESGLITPVKHKRNNIAYLKSKSGHSSYAHVMQEISPKAEWLGGRVRLTASVKTENVSGSAHLFMLIHHGVGEATSDYMPERRLKGTMDWQPMSIVLDIPSQPNALILFGVRLIGQGEVYFDNFNFELVSYDVDVTGMTYEREPRGDASNLTFETTP